LFQQVQDPQTSGVGSSEHGQKKTSNFSKKNSQPQVLVLYASIQDVVEGV
jgi:hypothetical protein